MKKIILVLIAMVCFFPAAVWGAEEISPEFNTICWERAECVKARKVFNPSASAKELESGWLEEEAPCDSKGWGKCLPGGVVNTSIKFGGQSRFVNLGEFLIKNYNYLLGIASILATIVIIVAGAQWAASGGNSELINGAKKRIGGAVIGIVIAYLSYAILNTLNPALVNLRLPQTFMARPQAIAYTYCNKSPSGTLFADAGLSSREITNDDFAKITDFPLSLSDLDKLKCGNKYFVKKSNGNTCLGNFCESVGGKARLCARDTTQPKVDAYGCKDGVIGGKVVNNSLTKQFWGEFVTEEWEDPPIDDNETELWVVCNNGKTTDVSTGDYGYTIDDKNQTYLIDANMASLDNAVVECEKSGGLRGFVLMFEMNESYDPSDEEHLVGWDNGAPKDLGDEGFFAKYKTMINSKYFIPLENIKNGTVMDLDASRIFDVDDPVESGDWKVYMDLIK